MMFYTRELFQGTQANSGWGRRANGENIRGTLARCAGG